MKIFPYSRQNIGNDDIDAVVAALKSDIVTQGPLLKRLEQKFSKKIQSQYSTFSPNATLSLIAACWALGVKAGDEVLVPNITFASTANCVEWLGGKPVLVECEANGFHMSLKDAVTKVSERTVGIIPMHYGGIPCDMREISEFARSRDLWILEDASHALGALYQGLPIGSCQYSDAAVFSFHPVKMICTGEGGAVSTNSEVLAKRLAQFGNNGITKVAADYEFPERDTVGYCEMQDLGLNLRFNEIQCALALSQLDKLDGFVSDRQSIAAQYNSELSGIDGLEMPFGVYGEGLFPSYHLFPLLIEFNRLGMDKKSFFNCLREQGITCQVHYIPLSFHPYYMNKYGLQAEHYPASKDTFERAVSIPIYPGMLKEEVSHISSIIRQALGS